MNSSPAAPTPWPWSCLRSLAREEGVKGGDAVAVPTGALPLPWATSQLHSDGRARVQ